MARWRSATADLRATERSVVCAASVAGVQHGGRPLHVEAKGFQRLLPVRSEAAAAHRRALRIS